MIRFMLRHRYALGAEPNTRAYMHTIRSNNNNINNNDNNSNNNGNDNKKKFKVLLVGGSGATGIPTVRELLQLQSLQELTIIGRKKYDGIFPTDDRLHQVIVDFDKLSDSLIKEIANNHKNNNNNITYDVIVSTMGTTRAQCKDSAEYRKIEVDYPTEFAKLGKQLGVKHAVLVTSFGAKKGSILGPYLSQKGEVEDNWKTMNFDTLTILKPGLLGRGDKMRTVEKLAAFFSSAIPCDVIGKAIATRVENVVLSGAKEDAPLIQTNPEIYQQAQFNQQAKL